MPRRYASRSTAERGGTCAATSAMCTQTRIAPPCRRSALIASSKSLAVGGSIVMVGSVRRSRRLPPPGGGAFPPRGRGPPAPRPRLPLDERVEAAPQPAVEHERLDYVARDVRAAE